MTLRSGSAKSRLLKNKLARYFITLGGIGVLFTLVFIFLYLLYVIKPIFDNVEVDALASILVNDDSTSQVNHTNSSIAFIGLDEYQQVAYQVRRNGKIDFYQLVDSDFHRTGTNILSSSLAGNELFTVNDNRVVDIVRSANNKFALLNSDGQVNLVDVKFISRYLADSREIQPRLDYPIGKQGFDLVPNQAKVELFSYATEQGRSRFVTLTSDKRLVVTTVSKKQKQPKAGSTVLDIRYHELAKEVNADQLLITPDLSLAIVRDHNLVSVYQLNNLAKRRQMLNELSQSNTVSILSSENGAAIELSADIERYNREFLHSQFQPVSSLTDKANISAMSLLSGSSSILFGSSKGEVSQWFEVMTSRGRVFKEIRQFDVGDNAIVAIYPELFRKSFFTLDSEQDLGIFYTTSEVDLWRGKVAQQTPQAIAISPRADALLVSELSEQGGSQLTLFSVDNQHPEITWRALWQRVWYEDYPEPAYIWQSSSGSDEFEAKFSLVPISFGTIKAAFYAMIFAIPIAITAAIYTAYFMPSKLRRKVKPTIEMMEALPTVILGFLAGLWLAPIIEQYLAAVLLLLIILPITVLLVAFGWHKLPKDWKLMLPESWSPLMLIPFIILVSVFAFKFSSTFEAWFFAGDMRLYVTEYLGIDYDQRNALVIGIAMGFAVIPTIFSIAEDAIFSVPKHLTSGALALGATPWQTLITVVLLTASPGIFSAIMMGLGRAVGETMIVLMATGNTPILDWNMLQGMRTLAANIAIEMPESEVGSSHYRVLFLAAFVLFVFTFIFNTLAELIRQRLRDKYSSL